MFCSKCGSEINDDAVVCPKCGCLVDNKKLNQNVKPSGLKVAIKVFMILSTVFMGLWILPLLWCIPMVSKYNESISNNKPVGTGFKICTLLFVNIIAGVLMLIDND